MIALTDQAIGVFVGRRVPMANVNAFETALGELKQISLKQPGQIVCDVVRGTVTRGVGDYFIAYRFADEMRLRAWESSPEPCACARERVTKASAPTPLASPRSIRASLVQIARANWKFHMLHHYAAFFFQ